MVAWWLGVEGARGDGLAVLAPLNWCVGLENWVERGLGVVVGGLPHPPAAVEPKPLARLPMSAKGSFGALLLAGGCCCCCG